MRLLVLTLGGAGLLAAVAAGMSPVPQPPQGDTLAPEPFAHVSGERARQIMYIGPGATPGSILVLTRHGLEEFDGDGTPLRRALFPEELWLPTVARVQPDGPPRIVGLRSRNFLRSWVEVLDLAGARLARLRSWTDGLPEVADVLGDAAREVLVRHTDGVAVLDLAGRRRAFVRSPRYLYHFRTVEVAEREKRALVLWMWRDRKTGADLSVRWADGVELAAWREHPTERPAVFALAGEPEALWSAVDGRFIQRAPGGQILRSFDVPGLVNFRYVHGGSLADGRTVLVGSSGGYGSGHGALVCVFDAGGELVGRSSLPLQAYGFYIPDPRGAQFLVGTGDRVLRYDAARHGRSAP